jgi:hypothetical protein
VYTDVFNTVSIFDPMAKHIENNHGIILWEIIGDEWDNIIIIMGKYIISIYVSQVINIIIKAQKQLYLQCHDTVNLCCCSQVY